MNAIDAACGAVIDSADLVYDELRNEGLEHERLTDTRDRFVRTAKRLRG